MILIYIAQFHVYISQMRFTITRHEIEPKALKGCRYTVPVWSQLVIWYMIEVDRSQHRGNSPTLSEKSGEFFIVPRVELVKVETAGSADR